MNERIKTLAYQADKECVAAGLNHAWEWEKRFAELIIKDCLEIVQKRTRGPYEITMTPETRNAWNTWIEIKEHFGVKNDL